MNTTAIDWRWDDLADALVAGLGAASAEVELEQAVRGLDARSELELHPVLREGLRGAGYGVTAEVRFPRDRILRRRSEGVRCDMVVTPGGRPLVDPAAQVGLFAPTDAVELVDAAWLEVKVVAQHNERGPNRAYASALQRPVWKDIDKLAADPHIRHGAAVLVLFTGDAEVAVHDLGVWSSAASLRGLRLMPREQRSVAIGDRLGNRLCTVAVFPLDRGPA
ncbi:hypothetical protein [Nannocystis bainbridge]|uniref:Restriction endonuclease n=1 Tax=Nannocystis bainbridge TaxID=2995303 RepID=A0ABT5E8W1_9BACT|nr:hypothetical protein [Nannocystis bainbridge]MDC0722294.1 hypothetical protein [Nannocystis bainbridge]